MIIEMWFDFICPFCYMGKRILEKALSEFNHQDEITIVFKSYELNPNEVSDPNISVNEGLAEKYGVSVEKARRMNENVALRAKQYGLHYNIDTLMQTNTFDAHRLMKYAETMSLAYEMTEKLFKAHFTDGYFIGSKTVLADLAFDVGLDKEKVLEILNSNQFSNEVRKDEQEAMSMNLNGVPFFLFNRKYSISGAQGIEVFIETLKKTSK